MAFGRNKTVLGLDIGRNTVKAVAARPSGRSVKVTSSHVLDCRTEGMLDDAEAVLEALPEWIAELGLANLETTVCVPQYLGTIQISDFPPADKANLEEMVGYETQQVAGLSEEGFLHDHAAMPAGLGKRNPAVIGIAKNSVVQERVDELAPTGLNLYDFTLSGIALANAYFALFPKESRSEAPHLLLDIGYESTTMVIVAAGQILSVASLLFGGQRYTEALARELDISLEEAESRKRESTVDDEPDDGPLHRATRRLESEIREAVDHWQSQETGDAAGAMFERICLSGGGAQLGGLAEHLGRQYGCEACRFEREGRRGSPDPGSAIAYGAALQGIGRASTPVSIAPASVTYKAARRANFGTLVSAVVLVALAAGTAGFLTYRHLRAEERRAAERIAELRQCETLIPKLEELIQLREHRERTILPVVATANRANRSLDALEALSEVRGDKDWFIYLADLQSYHRTPEDEQSSSSATGKEKRDRRNDTVQDNLFLGYGESGESGRTAVNSEFPTVVPVTDIRPLKALVAAGFSKYVVTEPYRYVREMVDRLNGTARNSRNTSHTELFRGVDLLPNPEIEPEKQLFHPWQPWMRRMEEYEGERYKPFMLKLPFAHQPIKPPKPK